MLVRPRPFELSFCPMIRTSDLESFSTFEGEVRDQRKKKTSFKKKKKKKKKRRRKEKKRKKQTIKPRHLRMKGLEEEIEPGLR